MRTFRSDDFLLQTETARRLYFEYAKSLPIVDYHNHLPPSDIAGNRTFANITEAWLEDDHYKWRAMRTWGISEAYCTGTASPRDKFMKWAEVVPYTLGNPLYHWTHMELENPFGIRQRLNPRSADSIYEEATAKLQTPPFRVRSLLERRRVEVVCTTDDPCSELEEHRLCKNENFGVTVLPTFRLDEFLQTWAGPRFEAALGRLSESTGTEILELESYLEALESRHEFFHRAGCRLSDAGISEFRYVTPDMARAVESFRAVLAGSDVLANDHANLSSIILFHVSSLNARKGWVQQMHLGALRDANSRKVSALGQGKGFDSIGRYDNTLALSHFLDALNRENLLAKTILYNLNPADNEVMTTMAANFNEGDIRGKVQHGAAWWFLDQKNGIEAHLTSVSSLGMLSSFVGMLTDSRSFLSFSRHEYFRRILCNFLGQQVEEGSLPHDLELLGDIVQRVCYHNAKEYFPFNQTT